MSDKPQLHVSQMDTLSKCGIQFQRRYGHLFDVWHQPEIIPPSIALVQGTTVHKVVEKNLSHKMQTGQLLPDQAIRDLAAMAWEAETEQPLWLSPDEEQLGLKAIGAAKDQAIGLSVLHHVAAAPIIDPIAVEEKFVIVLDGFPFDLAGTVDIRERDTTIADTKTKGQTPSANAAQSIQLGMYTISEQVNHGRTPKALRLDVLVKNKTPKYVRIEGQVTEQLLAATNSRIERAAELIESVRAGKQAFTPADPEHWCCTARFCGYARTCPFWSGRE